MYLRCFVDLLLRYSPLSFGVFSMTLLVWDGWISFVRAIRYPSPGLPCYERRCLDKPARMQEKTPDGRRLPLLSMLPSAWMVLAHIITLPIGNEFSPFQSIASPFCQVVSKIGKTVTYLDQALVLDMSVLSQINNIMGTHLFYSIISPLDSFDHFHRGPVVIKAKPKSVSISTSRLVDCWVPDPCAYAYGPSTVEGTTHEPALKTGLRANIIHWRGSKCLHGLQYLLYYSPASDFRQ